MEDVTLANAKARLGERVERAARGEESRITRQGRPVGELLGVGKKQNPVDFATAQALTADMPVEPEPARDWLRALRDDKRS